MQQQKGGQNSVESHVAYSRLRESLLRRAALIFGSLENHHGKTGGLTAQDVAVHFGGAGSALFSALDKNGDGEITQQVLHGTSPHHMIPCTHSLAMH